MCVDVLPNLHYPNSTIKIEFISLLNGLFGIISRILMRRFAVSNTLGFALSRMFGRKRFRVTLLLSAY